MHIPRIVGRYACILESYLRGSGTHRMELEMQTGLVDDLVAVAKGLKVRFGCNMFPQAD